MPVTLLAPPRAEAAEIPHKRWTRDECAMLESAGIDLERYELVEGELVQKMGKRHPHRSAVLRVCMWLRTLFAEPLVVQESSINVSPEDNPTSQPEPDALLLRRPFFELAPDPKPADVRLVVEV